MRSIFHGYVKFLGTVAVLAAAVAYIDTSSAQEVNTSLPKINDLKEADAYEQLKAASFERRIARTKEIGVKSA